MGRHFTEDKVMGIVREHARKVGFPQLVALNGTEGNVDAMAMCE